MQFVKTTERLCCPRHQYDARICSPLQVYVEVSNLRPQRQLPAVLKVKAKLQILFFGPEKRFVINVTAGRQRDAERTESSKSSSPGHKGTCCRGGESWSQEQPVSPRYGKEHLNGHLQDHLRQSSSKSSLAGDQA